MHLDHNSLVFVDSNVFIEHLFIQTSAAAVVIDYATNGIFKLCTSKRAINDTETVILRKLLKKPGIMLDTILQRWTRTIQSTKLIIFPDPPEEIVKQTSLLYLSSMRHQADIPILSAALLAKPSVILSGNRAHFNDIVAKRCGIRMYSCAEFVGLLQRAQNKK